MSTKKPNRIDLFNLLVYPYDAQQFSEEEFKAWCHDVSKEEYLEKRSFLLLDFYAAFRKLFLFFTRNYVVDAKKFYCEFDGRKKMHVTLKSTKPIPKAIVAEMETFFQPDKKDSYSDFAVQYQNEKHNTVRLTFFKG